MAAGISLDALKQAIRALFADQGVLPSERDLCAQFAVKRHRMRQVLGELRQEGALPQASAGRRPTSRRMQDGETLAQVANPLEVIEIRIILEPQLARLAALRASSVEIAQIQRTATTKPGADVVATDMAFHRAIAAGSRNGLAAQLYQLLRRVGTDQRVRMTDNRPPCPNRARQRDAEHHRVAAAIAARDPDAAEQAMREHLAAVQMKVVERIAPGTTVPTAA